MKLREEMQIELKAIQQQVGITFVFVTHDQQEALTMSDRIAVFDQGRIEQVGTPTEIYDRPATPFVAGFVGTSNLVPAVTARALLGRDEMCTIRPEHLRFVDPSRPAVDGEATAEARVESVQFLGAFVRVRTETLSGVALMVDVPTGSAGIALMAGETCTLAWRPENIRVVEASVLNDPEEDE